MPVLSGLLFFLSINITLHTAVNMTASAFSHTELVVLVSQHVLELC